MAPRTALNDSKVIRQAISRASGALARALAHCEDHDGSYRSVLDPAALARFEDVSHHLCEAAEHLEGAARFRQVPVTVSHSTPKVQPSGEGCSGQSFAPACTEDCPRPVSLDGFITLEASEADLCLPYNVKRPA